ncbi:MAG: hypothetical protein JRG67_00800 [Deltaproteobacteria bacterium]|nr:hypothetical protein [Deltaproteobacteria bacterium]MBW2549749.1 hypothetical protein [Deltaproteobacteria bacterium]MBW2626143.1 hypothetical protein [Deltaproteobacteria bacterium]MBW2684837.1 hypothetical protein [Deltaproteobacteria bacterium]
MLSSLGCDWSGASTAPPSETESLGQSPADEATPAVIDADWVASKLQAPPAPEPRDWLREVEKDPIAALKEMDPGALQPSHSRRAPPLEMTPIRAKHPAKYEPTKQLRDWPPAVGQFYPNLVLKDQTGQVTAISDFRGKVVLLEVVGLTCRACHAFAGGNEAGTERFRGIEPQRGLGSIESYAQGYAKVSLDHPDIVFVQLVLYGMDGRSPPAEDDARAWARHFGMDRNRNQVVLIGDQRFIRPESRKLIPGFHLIDQNGILRAMSSNDPRHDGLHESLLPKLASLVKDGR